MFKNYILVALRQFKRHKMFSALNIICLAIGISFCILIAQYIINQQNINGNLNEIQNQYYLNSDWKLKNTGPVITTVGPLAKALKDNYPGLVENYYRFNPVVNVVSAGDRHFKESIAIGDTTLISMYKYPLLYGDSAHAFTNNSSAIITENLAMKLFGLTNVLGKTVTLTNLNGSFQDYKVSAVLKSMPYNSVNNLLEKNGYSLFVPFEGNNFYPNGTGEDIWNSFYIVSFVQLKDGITSDQLNIPVKHLLTVNCNDNISKNLTVQFKPLKTYYLDAENGSVSKSLSILSWVAIGILLLAIVNFINIMMGTSAYRIKEIGLRKVFGSRRNQLVNQYLIESIVLTAFAVILSLLFYELMRPVFNDIWQTSLSSITKFNRYQIFSLIAVAIVVGSFAGVYPAFVLSRSNVVNSVKGKLNTVESGLVLRKTLLVLQFTIAIVVFIFSLTLKRQVNYFFHKDLGYDKEQLMVLLAFPKEWDSTGVSKMENIRSQLVQLSSVKDATLSFDIPERGSPSNVTLTPEGSKDNQPLNIMSIVVDENYATTFGLHLAEGRFFRRTEGGFRSGEVVINESAMANFGWKSAVGKRLLLPNGGGQFDIVGVIKDFNLSSLHESIAPLIFFHTKDALRYRYMTVKLGPGDVADHIEQIKTKWKQASPNSPFEYFFMDEKLQSLYQSELQLKKASTIAISLMLVIVMLGIFGVLTLTLTKRTKEIAVRKVLGAGILNIVSLFFKQYAGLLLISNLIAWPLTFYLSSRWLEQYAYRIDQNPGIYILAAVFVGGISFLLIYFQCFKAAVVNPVKSLKTE